MKKRKIQQKVAHILVSVFVLAIFIVPAALTGKWVMGMINPGVSSSDSAAAEISSMQVREIDKQSDQIKPFKEPLFSVTFDDGWKSIYTEALPILQEYGIPTTQYVLSGTFDHQSYMSAQQMKSMQGAGHEFGSHTITHPDLTKLDDRSLSKELRLSKKELSNHLGPINDFASPLGAFDSRTLDFIKKNYRSHKTTKGDPVPGSLPSINVKDGFTPMNIKAYAVRNNTTLDDIRQLIKLAQSQKGWFVLTYHQVDYSGSLYSVTPENFEKQMELLGNSQLRSTTTGQLLDVWEKENE